MMYQSNAVVNSSASVSTAHSRVSLLTILRAYLQVGLTGFGMAILQKLKTMVIDNHWLSEEEMNEGLALVQLYPGPIMVDFTAYVGYKLRGIPGALMATVGFVLPSFVLMVVLSGSILPLATCRGFILSFSDWKRWSWACS
jgi:chromate transport protein ChrA